MGKITLAGCIIFDDHGKILLMHRNEITPTKKRIQWETPGGTIEEGEDPSETAIRELKEELNIEVEILKKLGQKNFVEDDNEMEYTWYLSSIKSGDPKLMEDFYDDLKYFSFEEMREIESLLSANAKNFLTAYLAGEVNLLGAIDS